MEYFSSKDVIDAFPNLSPRRYARGQIILYQGDKPNFLFYIKRGCVKHYDIDSDGNERILSIIGQNSFFPSIYHLTKVASVNNFYSTLNDCELYAIKQADFFNHFESDKEFSKQMARWLAGELRSMLTRQRAFERNESKHKLLETFNYLLERHSKKLKSGWYAVQFPVNQQTLAGLTGLTRETVNTTLKELEQYKVTKSVKTSKLHIDPKSLNRVLDKLRG